MFIAFGEKFRKHARWIMGLIVAATIITLVGFFTQTGGSIDRIERDMPTIHGKPVDPSEYRQAINLMRHQYAVQGVKEKGTQAFQDRMKQDAVVQILLHRKAKELGVRVTNEELEMQIRNLPELQNDHGQFDPDRYRRVLIFLQEKGVIPAMFEEVVRVQLLHMKLQQLVTSGAKVTPTEVQQEYLPLHEKLLIDLVYFNTADYTAPVTYSNETVKAFYDSRPEFFRTSPQVKVRYAFFPADEARKTVKISDEDINDYYTRNKLQYLGTNNLPKPLEEVKTDIQSKLTSVYAERAAMDRATELTVKLVPTEQSPKPDFAHAASAIGVKLHDTGFFTATDETSGLEHSVAAKAFALGPDLPFSDPVAGSNGFYVLEYVDSKPSTIPPFEEVKAKADDAVKRLYTYDATIKHGQATVEELKKLVAGGKTFQQACSELKLKITNPPAFSVADEHTGLPGGGNIQQLALAMAVNATSEFIRTSTGGIVFHLRERKPADLAEFDKEKDLFAKQVLTRTKQGLYNDWLQNLVRQEQVDFRIKPRQTATEETESAPTAVD